MKMRTENKQQQQQQQPTEPRNECVKKKNFKNDETDDWSA